MFSYSITHRLRRRIINLLGLCAVMIAPHSAAGQERFPIESLNQSVWPAIAFSHDSRLVATPVDGSTIRFFDLRERNTLGTVQRAGGAGDGATLHQFEFAPDGATLAAVFGDRRGREAVLFDVATYAQHGSIPDVGSGSQRCVAFSVDGSKLAAVEAILGARTSRANVKIWDPRTLEMTTLLDSAPSCGDVAFSADGRWLATVHGLSESKGQVLVWDAATLKRRHNLRAAGGWLRLAFSPDGKWLAAGVCRQAESGKLSGVHLWDVESGKQRGWIDGHDGPGRLYRGVFVAFSPDSRVLAAYTLSSPGGMAGDGVIKIWDVASDDVRVLDRTSLNTSVNSFFRTPLDFSPDGAWLATAAPDNAASVNLWDARYWRLERTLDMPTEGLPMPMTGPNGAPWPKVGEIKFSPDGKWLAVEHKFVRGFRQGRPYWHEVVLWDLSATLADRRRSQSGKAPE